MYNRYTSDISVLYCVSNHVFRSNHNRWQMMSRRIFNCNVVPKTVRRNETLHESFVKTITKFWENLVQTLHIYLLIQSCKRNDCAITNNMNCKKRIHSGRNWIYNTGGAVVNLGESRKTDQPVSDFGGRHLPLSSVSFASRENLLAICPPFYSPRPLSTRVPLMRLFFLFVFPWTRRVGKGRLTPSQKYFSFFVGCVLDVPWRRGGVMGLAIVPRCYEMGCPSFFFLFMTLSLARYLFSHALCCSLNDFPLSAVSVRKSSPSKGYQIYTTSNVSA